MLISYKKVYSVFFYIIINTIFFILIFYNQNNFDAITYISIFQLIISILFIAYNKKNIISVAIIFLLLSYLFHFGQSIITTFNFNDIHASKSILSITSYELYIKAEIFAIISHFFLSIGIVFAPSLSRRFFATKINEDIMLKRLKYIARIVFYLSIIPLVYIDILKLIAVNSTGYVSTYNISNIGINKYLVFIAQFCRPAIIMLLISYKKEKRKSFLVFAISSIYFMIMMISGNRALNITFLIVNIFVYYKVIKKVRLRTLFFALIVGYFFLGFISLISILRDSIDINLDSIIYAFKIRSKDGIIYSILREFGMTIKSLCYSIQFIPEYTNYNYGMTYIWSLLNLLPKLPNQIVTALSTDFTFTKAFPIYYQQSLGGSYLGELYYNFGWLGSIFALFVGNLIGYVNNLIEDSVKYKNWLILSICIIIFPNILFWTRSYFVEILFKVFWLGLFIFIMYYRKRNNYNRNVTSSIHN